MVGELNTLRSLIDSFAASEDRPAVLALQQEGLDRWSYADLADYVRRLAAGLLEAGLKPDDTVALLAGNRPEWIAACLAVIQARGVVVPVDVQLDNEALQHVLNDSQARFIFTTTAQLDQLQELDLEADWRPILFDAGAEDERSWNRFLKAEAGDLPSIEPGHTATLFYTSGTTGRPKGVPLTHANLVFEIKAVLEAGIVTEHDRVLMPLPLHHVYPFVFGMLTPLAAGLPIIMPYSLTGPQVVRALQEGQVTLTIGVPRLYRALYSGLEGRAESSGWLANLYFKTVFGLSMGLRRYLGLRWGKWLLRPVHQQFGPHLKVVASGGSKLDPDLAWKLEALGWQVGIGYGLTETAPLLTLNPPGKARLDSAGYPIPGIEIQIDPSAQPDSQEEAETDRIKQSGQRGEILAKGPNVFSGYWNLPDKTNEVFTGDGWFRTGDLGYLDDEGYLHVTGRVSTLIITESGENIQPDEIESVFLASPVIQEIGVLSQDGRLVAVIVPEISEIRHQNGDEIEAAVRQAVEKQSKNLASYQRLSDYAVTRQALPRTRLGKIRRHLLPERYKQARQEQEGSEEAAAGPISMQEMSDQDQSLLENQAARQVWDWLTERYSDRRLTPDTSPQLDLGVDSLEWLNITLEIRQRTGVELDEEAVARIDTVRDLLSEVVEAGEGKRVESITHPLESPEEVLDEKQKRWLAPFGPGRRVVSRLMYGLNRFLVRTLLQLRVEGLENLPDGPVVLTPNHVSYLDAPVVAAALDYDHHLRHLYWAAARNVVFFNPLLTLVSWLSHTVPVESEGAASGSLALGASILKERKILVWFPEGRRSPSGELLPFRPGVGILLEHFKTPVVPVFINGTYEVLPPGQAWPRFQPVKIIFGQPLDPEQLESEGQADKAYDRIVQALRQRVVEMKKAAEIKERNR